MSILDKYLFITIKEKISKQSLMLIAIAMSTALLIVSLSVVDILTDIYMEKAKDEYGKYNIKIAKQNETVWDADDIEELDGVPKLAIIHSAGYVVDDEDKEFLINGVYGDQFKNYDAVESIKIEDADFEGKRVFLSQKTGENLDVKLGESVSLFIEGEEESYRVAGIYENEGLFKYDGENHFSIVIPAENLYAYQSGSTYCTAMHCAIKSDKVSGWVEDFNENNDDLVCTRNYDEEVIKSQFEWIQVPMIFMLIISLIMSTYIISCTFKALVSERLPIFGTFFSQGATYGQVYVLLLKEGLAYGAIGGLLGCVLGKYLTQFVSNYSVHGMDFSIYENQEIDPNYFLIGLLFSVIFSGVTVILPVLAIRKMDVKGIILNLIDTERMSNRWVVVMGIAFIIITAIISIFNEQISYRLAIPAVCIFLVGAILLLSHIVKAISLPISGFLRGKNLVGMLSFNNMATSPVIKNNISLIAVCVVSVIIISSLSGSITNVINGSYSLMNFNLCVNVNSMRSEALGEKLEEEVPEAKIYTSGIIPSFLDGDSLKPINMYYVDLENYADFEEYMTFEDKEKQLEDLKKVDNGVLLSKRMSKNYGVSEGDDITLNVNDKDHKMHVVGIVDCKMYAGGNYNIISKETAEDMFGYEQPTQYYIETDMTKAEVKKALKGYGAEVVDKKDLISDSKKEMKQFTDILSMFSYVIMVMGGIGVISNLTMSFVQRKREMAVMTSLGAEDSKKTVGLFVESCLMAIFGGAFGGLVGGVSLYLIGDVFKFLMLDLELSYPAETLGIVIAATIAIVILATIPVAKRFLALNIVKELKYE